MDRDDSSELRSPTSAEDDARSFEQLLYEEHRHVAAITLNRPRTRNALSMQLSDELVRALRLVSSSESTKVLVLRGAGGTFCAGDDINEMRQWGDANSVILQSLGICASPPAVLNVTGPETLSVRWLAHRLAELPKDRRRWLEVMSAHPILIQRPIITAEDGTTVIGRSEETVRKALDAEQQSR